MSRWVKMGNNRLKAYSFGIGGCVDYKELVVKSFRLAWRYKWLWVFGLFAGGGSFGGGSNLNFDSGSAPWRDHRAAPQMDAFFRAAEVWVRTHIALIVGVIMVLFIIFLIKMIWSIICQGALIGAAERLDKDEEVGFMDAVRVGIRNFWSILGFDLLLFLIIFVSIMLLVLVGMMAFFTVPLLLIFLVPLLLLFIPLAIAVGLMGSLGPRFIVIDGHGAVAAVGEAWRLLWRRLGPVALTWLISLGLGIGFGLAVLIVLAVLLVPTGIAGFLVFRAGFTLVKLAVFVFIGLAILGALLVALGAFGAYRSVYWTLAFRQMRALDA